MIKWISKRTLKIFTYLFLGTAIYFIPSFCRSQTDGFSIARITSDFPKVLSYNAAIVLATDEREFHEALNQPYHYLGSGGQCFAFVSQDDRYVIKFFKTRFYKFSSLFMQSLPLLPQKTRMRKMEKALFKLHRDFNSYLIASQDLKDETATLYLHLKKTLNLKKKLTITDKLGIAYIVDLDQFEFAIQRRAKLAYPHLQSLIETGQLDQARIAMHSLLSLSLARCKKGIYDEDAKIERNFGFIKEQPVFIDIGRFVKDDHRKNPDVYQKDLHEITRQLRSWIQMHYPVLTNYFNEILDAVPPEK